MSNEMISSISYISTARAGLTDADFQAILEEASKRNETLGLTGLLTFNGLNFMQTLEGSKKSVGECIRLIEADRRHDGLVFFDRREIKHREFPDWRMAGIMVGQDRQHGKAQLDEILSAAEIAPETRKHFESFQSFGTPAQ
ncbi:BLUF domain-containing protein [Sphingorhabdus sp. YGSMI21]|uniref:BLUF domain-containing protein n=1 Tax=Sphingorhabdus sp. YGSMI21 TaxID=2077182 RepID=UPI000C1E4244|nr:BLUF domain-containing protein [Sphingorhabdus sp. YGSMI21]ATW04184.1 hypothetical protein CHN51_12085 [Sphingorhabdus sp. YGSMI21]